MAGQALSTQQNDNRALSDTQGKDALSYYSAFVAPTPEGHLQIIFAVDGVHCAACIQKIESALYADPAVRYARLNFSTGRLTIRWKGGAAYADHLAALITDLGYRIKAFDPRDLSRDADKEGRFLLLCLGVAGFAAGNIMLLSFALWSTTGEIMGIAMRDFLHWIAALIALPAIAFSGRPFFFSAWHVLSRGHTNMDVPISLALILTSGMSLFETFNHGEHAYFDSAVMLMFFLLIGRYLDFRARKSARDMAGGLLSMMAGTATVIEGDGKARILPIRDLREGMTVRVAMGEHIPADGTVISGVSDIDSSLVTGESMPQPVTKHGTVYSGTLNISAPLVVKVARAASDSQLADIVRLMEQAEQGQAQYVRIADRAARLYTPIVHTLAAGAFLGWIFLGSMAWQQAMMIAVTVLIITCPCALGLAVPVVQVLAIGRLMKEHVLVKSGDALERLAAIDTVLLDKTGTLTLGRPALEQPAQYDSQALALAASLAVHSNHPLAKALAAAWDGPLTERKVQEHPGKGLSSIIDSKEVRLGSKSWCGVEKTISEPGKLELWLYVPDQPPIAFYFSDPLRPDAQDFITQLKSRGLALQLVSGDRASAASYIAKNVGIEHSRGDATPQDKFALLQSLRDQGHKTLMIGDGLNDAPVLAGADASISPSSAIDMAQNAADIVFMGDKLAPVFTTLQTARLTQKLVKQNFALAILYNIIAIPLALAGIVTPMIAAIAMSSSSLIVIMNSFRLRWSKNL